MPLTPKIEEDAKLMVAEIEKSNLGVEDKSRFISMVECSKATCNGMTTEEKIQGIAENNFSVTCVLARLTMMLKNPKVSTWKDVAIAALHSWHLVVIVAIVAVLLGFHPEIADVIKSFAHP